MLVRTFTCVSVIGNDFFFQDWITYLIQNVIIAFDSCVCSVCVCVYTCVCVCVCVCVVTASYICTQCTPLAAHLAHFNFMLKVFCHM